MNYGDEKCDVCHREALIAMSLCSACADERDQLRARLAEVERERDEAQAEADVRGGAWCAENRAAAENGWVALPNGNGPGKDGGE